MTFLAQSYLWALPLTLIPIALHFFNRRPPKTIRFSHVAWLRQAHQTTMPRKKLRDLLLLIVRTLLVLFLVLFFARPVLQTGGVLGASSERESIVFLFDVSASMGAVEGGRPSIEWVREQVLAALRRIPLNSLVGCVVYSDRIEQELAPTVERARVIGLIGELKPMPRATNVKPALKQALAMLANQPKGKKTLVVVSDQARNGWSEALAQTSAPEGFDPETRIILWEAVPLVENTGVVNAGLQLSEEGILRGQASIRSESSKDKESWKLSLNSRVVGQGFVPAGRGTNVISFQAQLPEGGAYSGSLELTPDAWPYDDSYYVAGRVPKGFRLLIVDGESGTAPSDSESYYLRSALESPRDPRLESLRVIRRESFDQENLEKYDVIVLANLDDLGKKEADVREWIEQGGGLFLTAGSHWPKAPKTPLGIFRSHAKTAGTRRIAKPDAGSPVLSSLAEAAAFQWDQIDVSDYVGLDADASSSKILTFDNGDPLLLKKSIGKGTALCLATSLDRAWTNLPAKPVFAPMMREIISSLADPLREQSTLNAFVGQPVRFRVPANIRSLTVIAPDGVASAANLTKDNVMEWPAPSQPGIHQVRTDKKENDFSFAVNIPNLSDEGDFRRADEKEIKALFPAAPFNWVAYQARGADAFIAVLQGRDITNPLLYGLFFLFIAETLLGWTLKKRQEALALMLCAVIAFAPVPARAGAGNKFVFAQLKHDGAWDPYPSVHERLLQMVKAMTNIPFRPERKVLSLDDRDLFDYSFLLVKGNSPLMFSRDDKRRLKEYIDRGGLVFFDDTLADAKSGFAQSVRSLMAELYPDRAFEKLPQDHALFRAFFLLRSVSGRRISEKYLEGLDVGPQLGGEGRTAVIYCPNDLFGAWVKDNLGQYAFSCEPGGEPQRWEAFKLTLNIVYFSLTGTYKKDAIHQPFIEMKLGS